jgi:hypothetical protein
LAAPADEEQDRIGGKFIFQIVKILATTPDLDREARSALGSSPARRRCSDAQEPCACESRT